MKTMKKSEIWDPYADFQQTILPNGLAVHSAFWNRSCIYGIISIHSGAISDPKGKAGLAHFVEHMLNSSNEKKEKIITGFGGSATFGTTYSFFTDFSFSVPIVKKSIAKTLKIFEKMLGQIPDDLFLEKERNIILQEFYRKYPTVVLNDLKYKSFKNAYQRTLFEDFMGGLGVPETINNISIEDIQKFFTQHYVPSNMSIVVVGGLQHSEVVKYVQENFSFDSKQGEKRKIYSNLTEINPPKNTQETISLSQIFEGLKIENTTFESFVIVPGSFSYENLRICRLALREILMHEIREKKQATYDVSVAVDMIGGCYDLEIETIFTPKNLKFVRNVIAFSFEKIRNRKRFERIKKELVMGYVIAESGMQKVCGNAQADFIKLGYIKTNSEEISELQAVSFEQYCELVDYLADPKRWWSLIQVP